MNINHKKELKSREIYRKPLKMFIYYLFFLILFNHFLTALAGKINTKRENDLRDINYKECPICYDEDIFKLLNRKCDGLATISDYNEMTDDNLLCLCDV